MSTLNKTFIITLLIIPFLIGCQNYQEETTKLIILHTNDTHSQIDPLKGKGGYEARLAIIDSIRNANKNVILLDAGDIFQGTPYFNIFNGKVEIGAYNLMKYDAVTLGNHEFDLGLDSLANRIKEASFPFVVSNYDVTNTPLEDLIKPYSIIKRDNLNIGIIGLGVNPENLVMNELYGNLKYKDPIETTQKLARELKAKGCDIVIVISHLGFNNDHGDVNITDSVLATKCENVDLILGGHTHNIKGVYQIKNYKDKIITVAQDAKAGYNIYQYTLTLK